jgi:hypothetical protein
MCIAVDRTQAGIVYGYIRAYFEMTTRVGRDGEEHRQ